MDFVKMMRSLEEFLFELLSWIVFYPRTILRIVRNPAGVARYTQLQLQQTAGEQFLEMISPVLTLLLSILIAHAIEMAAAVPIVDSRIMSPLATTLFGTDQGLLLSRATAFGLYSLIAAVWIMARSRIRIDRNTLRAPFFIQAYLVSPFALGLSTASVMVRAADGSLRLAGMALGLLSMCWYLWAQASAYRKLLEVGALAALAYAVASFAFVTVSLCVMGMLLLAA